MKIVVCVKQVPDTTEIRLDPKTGTLIRDGVPSIINPDDKAGLEEALRLKDKFGAHVTVITMGPPQADLALRECIAMGVDRAILLTDRKFAGADTLATSHALAAAINELEYDLVIAGRQAIDGDTAQVGPQIAEFLDLPQISYAKEIEFDGVNTLKVKRVIEDGYYLLETTTPALITVLAEANKARYMHVGGIVEAFTREVEIWDTTKVSVDESKLGLKGSPTKVWKSFTKGAKQAGKLHEVNDAKEAARLIVDKLKEKFIV